MKSSIDFITFITKHSAGYAEYLKYIGEKLLSGKHKIDWKCIESMNAERLPKGYKCVAKAGNASHSSEKHAVALHKALDYIEHDYVVFIDSDVVIVYNDWDDIIVNELNKYDCFGGAYSSESNDAFSRTRYKEFPTVNFFAFKKSLLDKVELNFYPFRKETKAFKDKSRYVAIPKTYFKGAVFAYNIADDKEAKVFGIDKGNEFRCDTGWRLPMIFHNNSLSCSYMPMYLITSEQSQLPFVDDKNKKLCLRREECMNEWHYNGKLFATHKKHGRKDPIDGKLGIAWQKRIELYIKEDL